MFNREEYFQTLAREIQASSLYDANTGKLHNRIMLALYDAYQKGAEDERERLGRCLNNPERKDEHVPERTRDDSPSDLPGHPDYDRARWPYTPPC